MTEFFTPEGNAAANSSKPIRRSVFTKRATNISAPSEEGVWEREQRLKRTVHVPDKEKYLKRDHYTVAELNKGGAVDWITQVAKRGENHFNEAEEQVRKYEFEYQLPIMNTVTKEFDTITAVCIKLHHPRTNKPWNKVAVIEADAYLDLIAAGVPTRWGIHGTFDAPFFSVKCYSKNGTIVPAKVMVHRYMFGPPLDMYMRFRHNSGLLVADNFELKKPRGKIERRSLRKRSPRDMLAEHDAIMRDLRGPAWVDFHGQKLPLLKREKVDFEYFAFRTDG